MEDIRLSKYLLVVMLVAFALGHVEFDKKTDEVVCSTILPDHYYLMDENVHMKP